MRYSIRALAIVMSIALVTSMTSLRAQSEATKNTLNLWQPGDPGQPLHVRGRVVTTDGSPVAGAEVYIRQADGDGNYSDAYRGSTETADNGEFSFNTVFPGNYRRVKHIHVGVTHAAHGSVETEILFKNDPNLDAASEGDRAIHLEEAEVKGKMVLYGRFEIVMGQ